LLHASEFVEGDNIYGLHIVLKRLNRLLHNICGDLLVFDCCANLDLEDSVGNGLLLPLSFPRETVHLNRENLVS